MTEREEQLFQVGDQVDYIDPQARVWVGPAEVMEVLWSEFCQFYLYVIDSPEHASACCDKELRMRGSGDTSDIVEELL